MSDPKLTIEALVERVKARGKSTGLVASVYTAVYLAAIELGFDIAVDGTVRGADALTSDQIDELTHAQMLILSRIRSTVVAAESNLERSSRPLRDDHREAVYAAAIAWRRSVTLLSAPDSPSRKLNAVLDEAIAFEDHAQDGGPYR